MRTTQQTGCREEANTTVSASGSRKTVLINKRDSTSPRTVKSDNHTVDCAQSSEQGASAVEDLSDRIALRAHELYEQRRGCHGEDQADWFEAERQILATA